MSLLQTELNDITCTYHDLLNNEHFCLFTKTPFFPLERTCSCTYVHIHEYFTHTHTYLYVLLPKTPYYIQYAHIKHNKNCKNRHIVIIDRNRIHRTCEMNENDYQLKGFAMRRGRCMAQLYVTLRILEKLPDHTTNTHTHIQMSRNSSAF